MGKSGTLHRVNTRIRHDQAEYLEKKSKELTVKDRKVFEGDIHRAALDEYMRKYPLKKKK